MFSSVCLAGDITLLVGGSEIDRRSGQSRLVPDRGIPVHFSRNGRSKLTENLHYRARTENLSWRNVGEEAVILDLETSEYLTLNSTAAVLWEMLCAGPATSGDLVDRVLLDFDVRHEEAEADVQSFIQSCLSRGLIQAP